VCVCVCVCVVINVCGACVPAAVINRGQGLLTLSSLNDTDCFLSDPDAEALPCPPSALELQNTGVTFDSRLKKLGVAWGRPNLKASDQSLASKLAVQLP